MPASNLPLSSRSRSWDGPAARVRMVNLAKKEDGSIDIDVAGRGFAIVLEDGQRQSDYKLPFADVIGDELQVVFRGVSSAIGRLEQVEGASEAQLSTARTFLNGQRARFNDMSQLIQATTFTAVPRNLEVNGSKFDIADDSTLLMLRAAAEQGVIPAIVFDAQVFTNGPNKNHFRFYDEDIAYLAKSFVGQPFLENHGQRQTDERIGTITNAWSDGVEIFETVKITTRKGISDFVDGKIDRFSIGIWASEADCSICANDMFDYELCRHWPGRTYEGVVCNAIWRNPEGIETSAVNVPAVDGTHILSQAFEAKQKFLEEKEINMDKEDELKQDETPQEGADIGGEQSLGEVAAIQALTFIAEDEDANQWLAESLNLPDMDTRIGQLEAENQALREDIDKLVATIDEQNGLGTYVQRPWVNVKSAREGLSTVPETETPKPKSAVRDPLALAKEYRDKGIKQKTSPRETAGSAFLQKIQRGGK